MMRKLIFLCAALLGGCASYPGWEYVRLENETPKGCVYKFQEPCNLRGNECLNWHKKRATTFGANTVVIQSFDKNNSSQFSLLMGRGRSQSETATMAKYYFCTGDKNIRPAGG